MKPLDASSSQMCIMSYREPRYPCAKMMPGMSAVSSGGGAPRSRGAEPESVVDGPMKDGTLSLPLLKVSAVACQAHRGGGRGCEGEDTTPGK